MLSFVTGSIGVRYDIARALFGLAVLLLATDIPAAGTSLRFFGNGNNDIDRVKIPVDDPTDDGPGPPADVGATDFTIEFWLKSPPDANAATAPTCSGLDWINGNIVIDRDRYNQDRKFGISLGGPSGGQVMFGVSGNGTGDMTLCATTDLRDGDWHHVAVQRRRSDGWLWIYVDGVLEAQDDGPDGDVSYPDDGVPGSFCGGPCIDSDPYLVVGAEKHDAGTGFPSFSGWIDELRLSTQLRYAAGFRVPRAPFVSDASTAALYHFDSAGGSDVLDTSDNGSGTSHGERRFGGTPAGPRWSTDTPRLTAPFAVRTALLATGLVSPVAMARPGDGTGRLFIVEQRGVIRIFDLSTRELRPAPFLDIQSRVDDSGNEQGLLGLAFHPDFATNGQFFVNYTRDPGAGPDRTVIARYTVTADPDVAGTTETVLFEVEQPAGNHNGGDMRFGPDGFLYVALGDGGGGGDPGCNGQNAGTLLGSVMRIDVDGTPPAAPNGLCGLSAANYGIPDDNPFVDSAGACDEIWAWGLRNPWRMSFDRLLGDLFIGDVGQNSREEINYQPREDNGGNNYGWNRQEGLLCYTGSNNPNSNSNCPTGIPACGDSGYVFPVVDYPHSDSNCSVTGGFRYRGRRLPPLFGAFTYGDFCTGRVWIARPHENGVWNDSLLLDSDALISGFGEDESGELYMLDIAGSLYRFVGQSFTDVTPDQPFWPFAESTVYANLLSPCDVDIFCGTEVVKRREMAVALIKARDGAGNNPPAANGVFQDVIIRDPDARFIELLFADGITEGCAAGPNRFCPEAAMTRRQLAVWLARAIHGGDPAVGAAGLFEDLALDDPVAPYAEQLLEDGAVEGCQAVPLRFCPDQVVTKVQAAAMLARGFALPPP